MAEDKPTPEQEADAAKQAWETYEAAHCPHCGKEYEDFSDLGCESCDARHPGFGTGFFPRETNEPENTR